MNNEFPLARHTSRHPWLAGFGTALVLAATLALLPAPAQAQGLADGNRQEASARLSSALIRLNRNPHDVEALTAAGNAALATGDTDAAVGFFSRALRIAPDDPQVEAGLAGAKVRGEDPFSAIPLFLAAEKGLTAARSAPISPELQGLHGLAYDLIGDNANAQQYYRQALAGGAPTAVNAEISRRLALSLAIGGDRRASETVLSTLLQKQDRAAWRARIFALAILGYEEEAVATARSTMPPDLALEIAPYLRYMRRLTPAQQAAAANLGHFPQASEIGHDDPRIAQYARTLDRSRLGGADQALIPAGAPLGSVTPTTAPMPAQKNRRERTPAPALAAPVASVAALPRPAATAPINSAPPLLIASRETQSAGPSLLGNSPPPPIALAQPRPGPLAERSATSSSWRLPAPVPTVANPVIQRLAPRPMPAAPPPASIYVAPLPKPSPAPTPQPPIPPPAARPSFSDAFATMSPVMVDITPERGAVDLRRIRPARAIAPPPPPPAHPSRIWVELGVGRDPGRIAFDWRRMVKDDPEIFHGKKPFVSGWARTNRLLVGPFETDKAANAFTEKLHKADHPSAFVWTSPAGQVVDPLDAP